VTDEAEQLSALTNPHSPGKDRVNGVLRNLPEFQKAFGCVAETQWSAVLLAGFGNWDASPVGVWFHPAEDLKALDWSDGGTDRSRLR
jgi:Peptidase family M13